MLGNGFLRALRGMCIVAVLMATWTAPEAGAALNGFEGDDGDQVAACATSLDWQCLSPAELLSAEDGSGAGDVGFSGGRKETEPDAWTFTLGSVQAKADIRGVWTAVTGDSAGRTFLNLSFVRAGNTGDTYVGIELNQRDSQWTNTTGTSIPCRSDGDVLISYAASQSPGITIHSWEGTGGPAACPDGRTGDWAPSAALIQAFGAAMNTATIDNRLGVDTLGGQLTTGLFGEASLDLGVVADVIASGAGGGCSYFRHMSVKTRSSAEVGSSLQDYAYGPDLFARACETPGGGDTTPPPAPTLTAPASSCTLPVLLTGTSEPGSTITIYDGVSSIGGAAADASGAWQVSLGSLSEGAHSLTAEATDAAGNTGPRTPPVTVSVDLTAPAAPVLRAESAGAGMVDVSGTAEPNRQVTISEAGEVVATVTSDATGAFATTLVGVSAGTHRYVATVADSCRASAASAPAEVTAIGAGDTTPPQAPALTAAATACALPLAASGTAEPGSTVTVYGASEMLASTTADSEGAWSVSIETLADGPHTLSADARDAAGNVSERSASVAVTLDTVAPAAPVLSAEWTGDGMVRLSGTAQAGSEVTIREDGRIVAVVTASSDGAFSATQVGVTAADHEYVATARDGCATSTSSAPAGVLDPRDLTPPAAPTISAGAAATCALPLTVGGLTEPLARVTVYDGAAQAGTTTADSEGIWSLALGSLGDGRHSLSASATDAAGNASVSSEAVAVAVDTEAPAAPLLSAAWSGDDAVTLTGSAEPGTEVTILEGPAEVARAVAGDDGTFSATLSDVALGEHTYTATARDVCRASEASAPATVDDPRDLTAPDAPSLVVDADPACALPVTVSGATEPGALVTVHEGDETLGTATAGGDGAWSLALRELSDGRHSLWATATDPAGNASARSAAVAFELDTAAPAAPELQAAWSGDRSVVLSGSAEAGTTVEIREGDEVVATVIAGSDGTFSTTLTDVSPAEHTYTATARDDCRASERSTAAGIDDPRDLTAPEAPVVALAAAPGCSLPLSISGTTEPGALVTVYAGDSGLGTATAGGDGAWSLELASIAEGDHSLTATARDAAGNVSDRAPSVAVTIDTTAPEAPVLSAAWIADGKVRLTGAAEPGTTVRIREGDEVVATVTAADDGSFSATLTDVTPAEHSYTATAADACRTSRASAIAVVADPRDLVGPAAPTLAAESACALPLAVRGTSEPGATVFVYDAGEQVGSAVAGDDGAWQLSLDALADGSHALTAAAADASGNLSQPSALVPVGLDTTAPAAPTFEAVAGGGGSIVLDGRAEPGTVVDISEGTALVASLRAAADGGFRVVLWPAANSRHVYTATASDRCRASARSAEAGAGEEDRSAETPRLPSETPPSAVAAAEGALRDVAIGTPNFDRECMHGPFRSYVPFKGVRRARFKVDGRLVADVRKPDHRGFFLALIDPTKYGPGTHTLTADITFRNRKRRPRTARLRFRRCDECLSRRAFRIRVPHLRHGERPVRARVYVNGRRVKVVKGKRLRALVVLRGLPKGTYRVKVITWTNRNRIHRSERRYQTCTKKIVKPERKRPAKKRG